MISPFDLQKKWKLSDGQLEDVLGVSNKTLWAWKCRKGSKVYRDIPDRVYNQCAQLDELFTLRQDISSTRLVA